MCIRESDFYCIVVQNLHDLEIQLFKVSLIIAQQNITAAILFGGGILVQLTYFYVIFTVYIIQSLYFPQHNQLCCTCPQLYRYLQISRTHSILRTYISRGISYYDNITTLIYPQLCLMTKSSLYRLYANSNNESDSKIVYIYIIGIVHIILFVNVVARRDLILNMIIVEDADC